MAKENNPTMRIHKDLETEIKNLAEKNSIRTIQASREIAEMMKKIKINNKKMVREIKF